MLWLPVLAIADVDRRADGRLGAWSAGSSTRVCAASPLEPLDSPGGGGGASSGEFFDEDEVGRCPPAVEGREDACEAEKERCRRASSVLRRRSLLYLLASWPGVWLREMEG